MKRIVSLTLVLLIITQCCGCAVTDWIKEQNERFFETEETGINVPEISQKPNIINAGIYDFDTFNPLTTKSQSVKEAMQFVYEPLFKLDNELRVIPVLAKDYNVSADGKTITINLKENIEWHDGTPFTASDVIYTIKVILNGETNYTDILLNLHNYIEISDYSIRLILKKSVPSYESLLTFPIIKNNTKMNTGSEYIPNGTGPFCYGGKASIDKIYFGAYENYHNGRAKIDALYVHMIPSYEQYMTTLEASEIDFASSETVDLTEYMPKGNLELYDYTSNKLTFLGYNLKSPILSGNLTRRALAEIIDKEEITDSVIFSRGIAAEVPINPDLYLYTDTNTRFTDDDMTANDYLGNDNWGTDSNGNYIRKINGTNQTLTFTILANSDSNEQMMIAQNLEKQFGRFGIKSEVIGLPYEMYKARIDAKSYDLFVGTVEVAANMDLLDLLTYVGYSNENINILMSQLGMTRNEEELRELFNQYGAILLEDMPITPLYFFKGSLISSANVVSGINPTPQSIFNDSVLWSVR